MRLTTRRLTARARLLAPIRTFADRWRPVHAPAQVQVGPMYEYSSGSSTDPVNGPSFQRQIFSVRLIARH